MEAKRAVMADIGAENADFATKYQFKIGEKHALRVQITEIEHILRQLRLEIE